jgi:F0F1-type ATP synthase membrane subunit b/b'
MRQGAKIVWGLLVMAVLLAMPAIALAAQEEEPKSAEQPVSTGFKWVHFVILAAVMYWLFTKVLPPIFRRKADNISSAISKATIAKTEAEKQLKKAEAMLANLEQEVAQFRALAQKEAAAELERLRDMMKTDAERIGFAARGEIEAAERAARVELKQLAAKLAVDRAESLVAKELTPALQEAMISNFVHSLQGRPN